MNSQAEGFLSKKAAEADTCQDDFVGAFSGFEIRMGALVGGGMLLVTNLKFSSLDDI